jgi:hypothetical protein
VFGLVFIFRGCTDGRTVVVVVTVVVKSVGLQQGVEMPAVCPLAESEPSLAQSEAV